MGKPYVRFDEGELEIEHSPLRQLSTLPGPIHNIFRAVAFRNSGNQGNPDQEQRTLGLYDLIYAFKERFSNVIATFFDKMKNDFGLDSFGSQILTKLAA